MAAVAGFVNIVENLAAFAAFVFGRDAHHAIQKRLNSPAIKLTIRNARR
jgi:hypothetical protein